MTRVVSLIFSTLIVAGLALGDYQNSRPLQSRRIFPRADDSCGFTSSRISGVFFGDFTTGEGGHSNIPLIIQDNMMAPEYTVNTAHQVNCSNPNSLSAYGLVVGGSLQSSNVAIHGSALIAGGGSLNEIDEKSPGCIVSSSLGTGEIDFNELKNERLAANKAFAEMPPTLIIGRHNIYSRARQPINGKYEVIQFNTCRGIACERIFPGEMSYAKDLLQNPNYFGTIRRLKPIPERIYVYNMPVLEGDTILVNSPEPGRGLNPCKVIYNVYPVGDDLHYKSDGTFELSRNTSDVMGGYTLAPLGNIIDSSVGGFGGDVVGKSYRWDNPDESAYILDYREAGGNCDTFNPCVNDLIITNPETQDSTDSAHSGTLTDQTVTEEDFVEINTDSTLSGTLTNQTPLKNSEFSTVTDVPSSTQDFLTITGNSELTNQGFSTVTGYPPSSIQRFLTVTGDSDPTDQGFSTVTGDPIDNTNDRNLDTCIPSLTIAGEAKTKTITGNAKTVTVDVSDRPSTFTLTHKIVTVTPSTARTGYTEFTTIIITETLSRGSTVTIEVTES